MNDTDTIDNIKNHHAVATGHIHSGKESKYWHNDVLAGYSSDILEKIDLLIEAFPYKESFFLQSAAASDAVNVTFHDAGHIIGSAGIALECHGYSIFHTGDVQFDTQSLLPGASFPKHHCDLVFTEATNCATDLDRKSVV
mgnify:CR=1 FL=1